MMKLLVKVLGAVMLTTMAVEGDTYSGTYVADKARTLAGAVFSDNDIHGVISLKIGKANATGSFKISGTVITLDGKKHAIKAVTPTLASDGHTYYNITLKDYGAMNVQLWGNGFTGSIGNGWKIESAPINSMPQGPLTFTLNPYPGSIDGRFIIRTEYLPMGLTVTSTGTKFRLPKAGTVTYKKGVLSVSKGGEENPSGLKLSYSANAGTFKGSFNLYALDGGRLYKYPMQVTGVTVLGYGFAIATTRKLTFSPQIRAYLTH